MKPTFEPSDGPIFTWHGAAHYHIDYRDKRIIIDPLYSRLPGAKPYLAMTKEDLDRVDYLFLTHGHLDHSWDFPYVLVNHKPITYAPSKCIVDAKKAEDETDPAGIFTQCHSLEQHKGKPFLVEDIEVTPFQIGTEQIDLWFLKEMLVRPFRHRCPSAYSHGVKWLLNHVFGNCFAFHFVFPSPNKTLLYFGNLTSNIEELRMIDHVDLLAIPYCPANNHWVADTIALIRRFKPEVTLVHHFDNFMHPFTLSKYMDLGEYSVKIRAQIPDAKLCFSKFHKQMDFDAIYRSAFVT